MANENSGNGGADNPPNGNSPNNSPHERRNRHEVVFPRGQGGADEFFQAAGRLQSQMMDRAVRTMLIVGMVLVGALVIPVVLCVGSWLVVAVANALLGRPMVQ
jgi:hypothetical protein